MPVVTDPKNKANMEEIKSKLNASDRMQAAKNYVIRESTETNSNKKIFLLR